MTSADVTGRPVGKRVSVDVFRKVVHEGIPLSSCVLGWDVDQWPGPVQEYTGHHTGWHDVRLVPDLETLRSAAWLERTAICVADFAEMGSDELAPVAPRTILRRQIERLADAGLTAQVASELEFALYHGSYDEGRANGYETLVPTTLARADYTIQAGDRYEGFFSGVRDALAASELGPWTSQVEWGLGQWEINLEYQRALEMADRHLLFKLAMRTLAPRTPAWRSRSWRGRSPTRPARRATCISRSSTATAGTCSTTPRTATDAPATLRHAIGGVLQRAPELMPFYAPTVNSYRRTTSGEFSGNGLSWGFDSRMVSCRVLTESPESTGSNGACPAPTWIRTSRSRRCSRRRATGSRTTPNPASR